MPQHAKALGAMGKAEHHHGDEKRNGGRKKSGREAQQATDKKPRHGKELRPMIEHQLMLAKRREKPEGRKQRAD